MTDLERIRALCQGLIDEAAQQVDEAGEAGAHGAVSKATVARSVLDAIDLLPGLTSPFRIPEAQFRALNDYARHGIQPGQCLVAILSDNLFEAMSRADEYVLAALPAIVTYIRSVMPAGCWGSPEAVSRWIARPRS